MVVWLADFAIVGMFIETAEIVGNQGGANSAVAKLNIPAAGFANQDDDEKCTGNEELTVDSVCVPLN